MKHVPGPDFTGGIILEKILLNRDITKEGSFKIRGMNRKRKREAEIDSYKSIPYQVNKSALIKK